MAAIEKFESPFGRVELTDEREKHILQFHPEVKKHRKHFEKTLAKPRIIRYSKFDSVVKILYSKIVKGKYLAIVIKTNQRNFILTAYITTKLKI